MAKWALTEGCSPSLRLLPIRSQHAATFEPATWSAETSPKLRKSGRPTWCLAERKCLRTRSRYGAGDKHSATDQPPGCDRVWPLPARSRPHWMRRGPVPARLS